MWTEMRELAAKFAHVESVSVGVFNVGENEQPKDLGDGVVVLSDGKNHTLKESLNDAASLPALYIFPGNLNEGLDPSLKKTPVHYHDGQVSRLTASSATIDPDLYNH
jgi:hypothetical protein